MRRGAAAERRVPFLERLVDHLPPTAGPWEHEQYLALLDRALLDRVISVREQDALAGAAADLGIDRATASRLHRTYLNALARAAWADGVVTEAELGDLHTVAALLGLPPDEAHAALAAAADAAPGPATRTAALPTDPDTGASDAGAQTPSAPVAGPPRFHLRPGDQVVFTGEMDLPRTEWIDRATQAGLVVHPNVTKHVALVVAADPDSLSGKARKADTYGIPIVTEHAFARMLDDLDARRSAL